MLNPNPNMLLRIAQGDAYGMATEYIKLPRDQTVYDQALEFTQYCKHPTHNLMPGQYTDDTQMSIAVAEVLLGDEHTRPMFADAFVRCFKRDQRDGYARHFQAFLESVVDVHDFLARINPASDKNGAAMRSVPIGVLSNPNQVIEVAQTQAKLTHDTLGGIASSIFVSLMSHFALYRDEPFSNLPAWLEKVYPILVLKPWPGGRIAAPDVGLKTASAVLRLLIDGRNLIDIAKTTIEWGGDTDSVLAIAWGIASARMREPLPEFFEHGLERGPYGYNFLAKLGETLMMRYSDSK